MFDFLTGLLSTETDKSKNSRMEQDRPLDEDILDDSENEDSTEMTKRIAERKEWSRLEGTVSNSSVNEKEETNIALKQLLTEKVSFKLQF